MRRKRFQHHVNTMVDKFLGYCLYNDLRRLGDLKEGILQFDVLNGTCVSNGKPFHLEMTAALQGWFRRELSQHNIDISKIDRAQLKVVFKTNGFIYEELVTKPPFIDFEFQAELQSGPDHYSRTANFPGCGGIML